MDGGNFQVNRTSGSGIGTSFSIPIFVPANRTLIELPALIRLGHQCHPFIVKEQYDVHQYLELK